MSYNIMIYPFTFICDQHNESIARTNLNACAVSITSEGRLFSNIISIYSNTRYLITTTIDCDFFLQNKINSLFLTICYATVDYSNYEHVVNRRAGFYWIISLTVLTTMYRFILNFQSNQQQNYILQKNYWQTDRQRPL